MKIPLKAWAARQFDPPPHDRKLREIARAGKIDPAPVKLGREYWVEHVAQFVAQPVYAISVPDGVSGRVADILRAA